MNKKNMVILAGYNKSNLSWLEHVKKIFDNEYNIFPIKYDNWTNDDDMNFNDEIEKIYQIIKDLKVDIILAKSIGIYLIVKVIAKYKIELKI